VRKTYIGAELRRQVGAQCQHRCAYCYGPETRIDMPLEVDHIIPEARGGPTVLDNLALAYSVCNARKASRFTAVDPNTDRCIRLFNPALQRWSSHFAWSNDGLTIHGKTACGRATALALGLNDLWRQRIRLIWILAGSGPPDWPMTGAMELPK
jgi:hypothetical protein